MRVQLKPPKRPTALRDVLHSAAIAMLLVPATAKARRTTEQIDFTSLLYSEARRTQVVEPIVRYAHLLPDGPRSPPRWASTSSPARRRPARCPTGRCRRRRARRAASRHRTAGPIPTQSFQDHRFAIDAEWKKPFARFFTTTVGGHVSREKDYRPGLERHGSRSISSDARDRSPRRGSEPRLGLPAGGTPLRLCDRHDSASRQQRQEGHDILFRRVGILNRHVDGRRQRNESVRDRVSHRAVQARQRARSSHWRADHEPDRQAPDDARPILAALELRLSLHRRRAVLVLSLLLGYVGRPLEHARRQVPARSRQRNATSSRCSASTRRQPRASTRSAWSRGARFRTSRPATTGWAISRRSRSAARGASAGLTPRPTGQCVLSTCDSRGIALHPGRSAFSARSISFRRSTSSLSSSATLSATEENAWQDPASSPN